MNDWGEDYPDPEKEESPRTRNRYNVFTDDAENL